MRLLQFLVRKFKGVELAELTPDGKPVLVKGDNEAGKTSLVDAFAWCITGLDEEHPLRDGYEGGEVSLVIGEPGKPPLWTIRRRMRKEGNPVLDLLDAHGDKQTHVGSGANRKTALAFIKDLYGAKIAWNPCRFDQLKPAERVKYLRDAAGVDTSEIDAQYDRIYAVRTEQGRRRDAAKTRAQDAQFFLDAPEELVSVVDLMEKIDAHRQEQGKRQEWESARTSAQGRLDTATNLVNQLQEKLAAAKREVTESQAAVTDLALSEVPAPAPEALAELQARVDSVEETNEKVEANKKKELLVAEAKAEALRYDQHSEALRGLEQKRKDLLQAAALDIPGLEVSGDEILIDGRPYDENANSRRMKVAMLVGAALCKDLRIALVDNGEGMGSRRLAEFFAAAEEAGIQPIVTRVVDGVENLKLEIWEGGQDGN